ncbi:MAG: ATP-binding protein [Deltaproteobacteria bacterium]|nr:ATP-binding protein [Deltaproteobacteria bacterium]
MKEVVIISGKGGTGKTSIAGCFAALARNKVLADADVDAADLFILLEPSMQSRESFRGGHTALIDMDACVECGECLELCRYDAISQDYVVDKVDCEGCGVCAHFCPAEAIEMQENICGEWFVSDTRYGPFVHAKLGIAEENSGMLVTIVRHNAKLIAEEKGLDLVIVDGPPGIGCPVISAVTGANLVFIVTEPTLPGLHDMQRVAALAKHFNIPAAACINKYDLNPEMSDRIRGYCEEIGVNVVGMIPYDTVVSKALVHKKIIVEYGNGAVSDEIKKIWHALAEILGVAD